jgi:hypothetical protein
MCNQDMWNVSDIGTFDMGVLVLYIVPDNITLGHIGQSTQQRYRGEDTN